MSSAVPDLSRARCRVHGGREAVARCRECSGFFCRECVVEHEGRMVCTDCLRASPEQTDSTNRGRLLKILRVAGPVVSVAFAWLVFSLLGRTIVFFREVWGVL